MNKADKKGINWSTHLMELIVVFVGVTAAFLLNKMGERSIEHQREQQYIQSFSDDLVHDQDELRIRIKEIETKFDRATRVVADLKVGKIVPDTAMLIFQDIAQYNLFAPQRITYGAMAGSGDLKILSSFALKEQLVQYYLKLDELKQKEDVYTDFINSYVMPFSFQHMDIVNSKFINPSVIRSVEFRNTIMGYYILLVQNLDGYKEILGLAEALSEKLQTIVNN